MGLDDTHRGLRSRCAGGTCQIRINAPRQYAGVVFPCEFRGPHFVQPFEGGGGEPSMVAEPPLGTRQRISVADAILIGEVSSFRPNVRGMVPAPAPAW